MTSQIKFFQERFSFEPIPPFRLDLTVWVLRRSASNVIDYWHEGIYERIIVVDNKPFHLTISQNDSINNPKLEINVLGILPNPRVFIEPVIRWMLGLDIDLNQFYDIVNKEKLLNTIFLRFKGVKPPRFPTLFESLINGICFQQLSLQVGTVLLNRLAKSYGLTLQMEFQHAMPTPENLLNVNVEDLRKLGFSQNKAISILDISKIFSLQKIKFENFSNFTNDKIIESLKEYRGVGRWTAEYVLLRGFGKLDCIPGDDIGAQNSLKKLLGIESKLDYHTFKEIISQWHPFEGLVYFHFLLEKLYQKDFIKQDQTN